MDLSLPFRGSEAVRAGEVGRRRLQGPAFVALDHDVHVLATTPVDLAVRMRAVLLRRPHGVIAGAAAAAWWDAGVGPVEAVEVQVGRSGARGRHGVVLWHDHLEESEVVERDGLRLTCPTRTAYDLSRRLPFPEGLVAADLLADRAMLAAEVGVVRARWREAGRRRARREHEERQKGQPKAGHPTAESTATATKTAVR